MSKKGKRAKNRDQAEVDLPLLNHGWEEPGDLWMWLRGPIRRNLPAVEELSIAEWPRPVKTSETEQTEEGQRATLRDDVKAERLFDQARRLQLVLAIVRRKAPVAYRVWVLYYEEEKPQSAIAAEIGVSQSTVSRKLLPHALATIQQTYRQRYGEFCALLPLRDSHTVQKSQNADQSRNSSASPT